jgi:hypothetical protein
MSDTKNGRSVARDALGILGMVIGVFSAVSIVMAYLKPVRDLAGEPVGFYMSIADLLGPIAGVFGALGIAFVGVRLWLAGIDGSIPRHLLGLALTTFMLAILVGTLDESLAGSFGGAIGSAVRVRFTVWVAVPTGLALVLLPAWFAWLRPAERHSRRENPGTLDSALTQSADSGGVTASEAEALLPKTIAAPVAPSTPYPTDVRRAGGIPAGARPLETSHGRVHTSSHDVVHVQPAGLGAGAEAAGAARPVAGARPAANADAEAAAGGPFAAVLGGHAAALRADAQPLSADESEKDPAFTPELPTGVALARPISGAPAAPSWEQPDMFEEPVDAYGTPMSLVESLRKGAASGAGELDEALDSEDVVAAPKGELDLAGVDLEDDADVESVQPLGVNVLAPASAPAAEVAAPLEPPVVAQVVVAEAVSEVLVIAEPAPAPAPVESEPVSEPVAAHEVVPAAPVAEAAPLEPELLAVAAPAVAEVEEAPEEALEEDSEEDSEEELDEEVEAEQPVAEADDDEFEDEEECEACEVDEVDEVDEEAPVAAAAHVEPVVEVHSEADSDEEEALEAPPVAEVEPVQPSLFADLEPEPVRPSKGRGSKAAALATEPRTAPSTASIAPTPVASVQPPPVAEAEVEAEAAPTMSDVVLTPAPARSISRVFLPEPTYKAGCLFLERNRVAVSMLQREFQMDFKVATAVLDQLQDVGLIGPYLGGQRRDILMSADEWQEKVGVAE